jgi:hypothetical protein
VSFIVDVSDEFRRAINYHYDQPGLATRADVKLWLEMYGHSCSDDIMFDLDRARDHDEEGQG